MSTRGNILRIKIKNSCTFMGDPVDPSDESCTPACEFSMSVDTSIDQGAIEEAEVPYQRDVEPGLDDDETAQLLQNQNVYTDVYEKENAYNLYLEYVKEVDEGPEVVRSEHICSVCGKDFKSMKSLSGHMRCHPERGWRGIQPPPTVKNSASSTVSESRDEKMDDQNDIAMTEECLASELRNLFNWSTKRSRHIAGISFLKVPNCFADMQENEIEAAANLVILSHEDPTEWRKATRKQVSEQSEEADSIHSKWEKSRNGEEENTSRDVFRSETAQTGCKTEITRNLGKRDCKEHQMQIQCRTDIRKKMKFQDVETVHVKQKFMSSASHICRTCNKSFSSHQALGGHMASHKKGPIATAKVDEISAIDGIKDVRDEGLDAAYSKSLPEGDVGCSKAETMVHRCKTCNKTFSSGQALGGHQRCHWNGGGVEAPTNSITSQEDENRGCGQPHAFDLNELPIGEDC